LQCTNMDNELQKLQLEAHLLKQSQGEVSMNIALGKCVRSARVGDSLYN
jgi:hypothetical protein